VPRENVGVSQRRRIRVAAPRGVFEFPAGEMRTSMQKEFDAGRPLELEAIAGAITRGGRQHRIQTPATEELVRLVEARLIASAA
jgi:ketopantoate reductase